MSRASRTKGSSGQREVAHLLRGAGLTVTALRDKNHGNEVGQADALVTGRGVVFTAEFKRAERWKMGEWEAQLAAATIPGTVPLLALRRNRGVWYGLVPLATLAELAAR